MHPVRRSLINRGILKPLAFGEYIIAQGPRADQRALQARSREAGPAHRALAILQASLKRG